MKIYPLCSGNFSVDFSANNVIKTGVDRSVYDFSVDYSIIDTSNIVDIHKYLMKIHDVTCITCITAMMFFSCNALKCVSMNHQECKIRPVVMNINTNETLFYPHSILVMTYNFYAELCVPDVVKNMNIKVSSQISRTNETRYVSCHKTCKCKCRCECKELTNKRIRDEDLFRILVNVNVINHVFLDNIIYIMKVVNVEKKSLIN